MTTIDALTKTALATAVDYTFIKEVIGDRYKVGFMDYESFGPKTTLPKLFKNKDCLAILFHTADLIRDRSRNCEAKVGGKRSRYGMFRHVRPRPH